jgi:hypothetical protein
MVAMVIGSVLFKVYSGYYHWRLERMALYRLRITKQLSAFEAETGLLSIWKKVCDPIFEMRVDHIIPVFNYSSTFKVIIDWDYWRNADLWSLRIPWSGLLTDPGCPQGRRLEFLALDQKGAWASLWVNSPQSFRLKYMPYYNMNMKIYEGLTEISGFLFSLTARWHLEHLLALR